MIAPAPGQAFRDRYLDVPFDLSGALFVATATSLSPVPAMLREGMMVVELPGYTEAEKRTIAINNLLPLQLAHHGLKADQLQVTDEAVGAVIRGYTRETGVWRRRSATCAPKWCAVAPRETPPGSRLRRRPSWRCSARRSRMPTSPAAPGVRAPSSGCTSRRATAETCRPSKRAGCPAPGR